MFHVPYTQQELESFVNGIIKVRQILDREAPDLLLAPMMGAVPFFDALNVVNPEFDNSRVYYVPASSTIKSLNNILPGSIENLLLDIVEDIPSRGLSIMSVDEVVSGSSVVRVHRKVTEGLKRYAHRAGLDAAAAARIRLRQIGLEHGYHLSAGKDWNAAYKAMREAGDVIPVRVDCILTMDNPLFCPVRYVRKPGSFRNTPVLAREFPVSQEYIQFLADIARSAGTDVDRAHPYNLARILEHQRYIPARYRATEPPAPPAGSETGSRPGSSSGS